MIFLCDTSWTAIIVCNYKTDCNGIGGDYIPESILRDATVYSQSLRKSPS